MSKEVTIQKTGAGATKADRVPDVVRWNGPPAETAWDDFFYGRIPNPNTRRAYRTAVRRFLEWCGLLGNVQEKGLAAVTAGQCGRYLEALQLADYSKKLHRTANKQFFDLLVERHVVLVNPFQATKTARVSREEGVTPRIKPRQVSRLLGSIDRGTLSGLRDHTVIAVLAGCGVRAHSVSELNRGHYRGETGSRFFYLKTKGGKEYTVPLRSDVERWFDEYLNRTGLRDAANDAPLFRPLVRRSDELAPWRACSGDSPELGRLKPNDVCRMVKRRMKQAGLPHELSAHSFRVNVVTSLREVEVPIGDIQKLVGHADARTTMGYVRSDAAVKKRTVELIKIDGPQSVEEGLSDPRVSED